MALINIHEIQTVWGYKSVEFHHDDISRLNMSVDCIVVSAFASGYTPIKGTVLGSLYEHCNVNLKELINEASINLTVPFNIWISQNIQNQSFSRIACIEILGTTFNIDTVFKNLTSLLLVCENNDIKIESIALPVLGTSYQGLNPNDVLPHLLENTFNALKQVKQLKKLIFVEYDEHKIQLLDDAINTFLKRNPSNLIRIPKSEIYNSVNQELLANLHRLKTYFNDNETINELIDCLQADSTRMIELGVLGRRLIEFIVQDIHKDEVKHEELWRSIGRLSQKNIAPWIISYMHIIRTFGNLTAHSQQDAIRFPKHISEHDLYQFLICLNRITDFWYQYQQHSH